MPVESSVDLDRNTIVRTVSGVFSAADVRSALSSTQSLPGFKKGMHAIWDLSQADMSKVDSDELLLVVDYIKTVASSRGEEYKIAIVATSDLHFGLSRMFQAYGEELPQSVAVHRSLQEAREWIAEEM